MDNEKRLSFLKSKIKNQLESVKDQMGVYRYKLYLAMVDECNDFEELREMAELDLQMELFSYVKSEIDPRLSDMHMSIKEVRNMDSLVDYESVKEPDLDLDPSDIAEALEDEEVDAAMAMLLAAQIRNNPDGISLDDTDNSDDGIDDIEDFELDGYDEPDEETEDSSDDTSEDDEVDLDSEEDDGEGLNGYTIPDEDLEIDENDLLQTEDDDGEHIQLTEDQIFSDDSSEEEELDGYSDSYEDDNEHVIMDESEIFMDDSDDLDNYGDISDNSEDSDEGFVDLDDDSDDLGDLDNYGDFDDEEPSEEDPDADFIDDDDTFFKPDEPEESDIDNQDIEEPDIDDSDDLGGYFEDDEEADQSEDGQDEALFDESDDDEDFAGYIDDPDVEQSDEDVEQLEDDLFGDVDDLDGYTSDDEAESDTDEESSDSDFDIDDDDLDGYSDDADTADEIAQPKSNNTSKQGSPAITTPKPRNSNLRSSGIRANNVFMNGTDRGKSSQSMFNAFIKFGNASSKAGKLLKSGVKRGGQMLNTKAKQLVALDDFNCDDGVEIDF